MAPLQSSTKVSLIALTSLGVGVAISSLALRRRRQVNQHRIDQQHDDDENSHHHKRFSSRTTGTEITSIYGREYCCCKNNPDGQQNEQLLLYVITGATSGLGLETAKHLSTLTNVYIILGCRDCSLGNTIAKKLSANSNSSGNSKSTHVGCIHLHLTNFTSVKSFASSVLSTVKRLGVPIHGLIHNAGIYGLPGTTNDGYQITFQTNILSPALLTELLLPYTSEECRVVHVSSKMMKMIWNSTRKEGRVFPPVDGGGSDWDYALSKACQGLHALELNIRFASENNVNTNNNKDDESSQMGRTNQRRAFAIEPGLVQTNISRHLHSWVRQLNYFLLSPIVKTIDEGTATTLFCLLAPPDHLDTTDTTYTKKEGDDCVKPYYFAECKAEVPPRCCRCKDNAMLQGKVFMEILQPYL